MVECPAARHTTAGPRRAALRAHRLHKKCAVCWNHACATGISTAGYRCPVCRAPLGTGEGESRFLEIDRSTRPAGTELFRSLMEEIDNGYLPELTTTDVMAMEPIEVNDRKYKAALEMTCDLELEAKIEAKKLREKRVKLDENACQGRRPVPHWPLSDGAPQLRGADEARGGGLQRRPGHAGAAPSPQRLQPVLAAAGDRQSFRRTPPHAATRR